MENSYFIYGPSATTTVTPMSARDNAEWSVLCIQLFHKVFGGSVVRDTRHIVPGNHKNRDRGVLNKSIIPNNNGVENNKRGFTTKSGYNGTTPYFITINDGKVNYNIYFSSRKWLNYHVDRLNRNF
jgi:hypothetical protein